MPAKNGRIIYCHECSEGIYKTPAQEKRGEGKYCSRKCAAIGKKSEISGSNSWMWKGGKRPTSRGYIIVYSPKHPFKDKAGYMLEHRLVMEKHLGRYLFTSEVVHHINRIKDDNRIENLELFGSHSEHALAHHRDAQEGKFIFAGYKSI